MIVGYSQFRSLLVPKGKSERELEQFQEWLLQPGPDLVVADEAHQIKNQKSQISQLFSQIRTGSRIATTGSPLSNHLEEYWAMMDWIHPDFLGTLSKFSAQYSQPIKAGLYRDSTIHERRTSQTRLFRLTCVLDDKLQRKDISVIRDLLPQKTEFVITVPLTPLQRQLYEELLKARPIYQINGIFKWINLLRLICNHPKTLLVREEVD
jgi:SNF2 family DNA or RNA helicase